jgi:hypothetical protein
MRITLAERNNNPGNLRFAKQRGAVLGAKGFAKFRTPQEGFEALKRQILFDVARNLTAAEFIHKYAPPHENNTNNYLKFFCIKLNAIPTDLLKDIVSNNGLTMVAKVISMQEDYKFYIKAIRNLP